MHQQKQNAERNILYAAPNMRIKIPNITPHKRRICEEKKNKNHSPYLKLQIHGNISFYASFFVYMK
jgi:hypothetical protein